MFVFVKKNQSIILFLEEINKRHFHGAGVSNSNSNILYERQNFPIIVFL